MESDREGVTTSASRRDGPARRARIAVIEDEPIQRTLYAALLEQMGYRVHAFASTLEFRKRRDGVDVDLILLDWELPHESGRDFLVALRASDAPEVPVIFLTLHADESRMVEALRLGADDYVIKPPATEVLMARVESVLRRVDGGARQQAEIDFAPYAFDVKRGTLSLDGAAIVVTPRELALAHCFFQNAGRVLGRDALMVQVWNTSPNVSTRSIDTFVSRIKKKLVLDGRRGWKLEGVYQRGYRLSRTAEPAP